jgi:hypothetical protein
MNDSWQRLAANFLDPPDGRGTINPLPRRGQIRSGGASMRYELQHRKANLFSLSYS